METEASGGTSGSGGPTTARDSAQSVSGVTEAGSSGNERARRQGVAGLDDDDGSDGRLAVVERADSDEREASAAPPFAARLAAARARIGWLLLGFLAGAAVAAAVLFVVREQSTVACTVVPT